MIIDNVITHLRQMSNTPFKVIAGAAEYSALQNEVNPNQLPAAYVIPLSDEADINTNQTFLRQHITETIAIIVLVDNRADRRGQTAVTSIEVLKYALFAALLYWRPPDIFHRIQGGLSYTGGSLMARDFARLEWEFRFSASVNIDQTDGWQVPSTTIDHITLIDKGLPGVISEPHVGAVDKFGVVAIIQP